MLTRGGGLRWAVRPSAWLAHRARNARHTTILSQTGHNTANIEQPFMQLAQSSLDMAGTHRIGCGMTDEQLNAVMILNAFNPLCPCGTYGP
jgi:hypothetical protein